MEIFQRNMLVFADILKLVKLFFCFVFVFFSGKDIQGDIFSSGDILKMS